MWKPLEMAGQGGCQRCFAAQLGTGLGGTEGDVNIYSWPTCFPGRSGQWVPKECLLKLGAGIKQLLG